MSSDELVDDRPPSSMTELPMKPAYLAIGIAFLVSTAAAQHRHHPPEDEALHEKFYSTWYMPDNPSRSCCNKVDCYLTEIKYAGSAIYARRALPRQALHILPTACSASHWEAAYENPQASALRSVRRPVRHSDASLVGQ
jgi:hypothetical protein